MCDDDSHDDVDYDYQNQYGEFIDFVDDEEPNPTGSDYQRNEFMRRAL